MRLVPGGQLWYTFLWYTFLYQYHCQYNFNSFPIVRLNTRFDPHVSLPSRYCSMFRHFAPSIATPLIPSSLCISHYVRSSTPICWCLFVALASDKTLNLFRIILTSMCSACSWYELVSPSAPLLLIVKLTRTIPAISMPPKFKLKKIKITNADRLASCLFSSAPKHVPTFMESYSGDGSSKLVHLSEPSLKRQAPPPPPAESSKKAWRKRTYQSQVCIKHFGLVWVC